MSVKYLDVYNNSLRILRKESSGRGLRPGDFKNLIPMISEMLQGRIYDDYSKNADNTSNIGRFFRDVQVGFNKTNFTLLPTDYYKHRGIIATSIYGVIDIYTDIEYMNSLKSYVLSPSEDYPAALISNGKIILKPDTLSEKDAVFPYIRKAETPEFDYVVKEDGALAQVDEAGFDFDLSNEVDLITITLELLGVQLKRQDILQYSKIQQNEQRS